MTIRRIEISGRWPTVDGGIPDGPVITIDKVGLSGLDRTASPPIFTESRLRLSRHKSQRQALEGMQRIGRLVPRLAVELESLIAFRQCCEDDLAFHPGNVQANAHMQPVTESHMTHRVALEVEHIGVLPSARVAICRAKPYTHLATGRHRIA